MRHWNQIGQIVPKMYTIEIPEQSQLMSIGSKIDPKCTIPATYYVHRYYQYNLNRIYRVAMWIVQLKTAFRLAR